MTDHNDEIAALLRRRYKSYEQVKALKSSLTHHRFHGALQRRHLMERLARAERTYRSIQTQLAKDGESAPYSLYQRQVPQKKNGFNVTVELSLDGFAFSNPAPKVPNGVKVWVRAKIEENHSGLVGIPKSHEIIHVLWSYSSKYHRTDHIGPTGHNEYMVSNPLILTREFISPSSGSTKHNFFVYVDAYERID